MPSSDQQIVLYVSSDGEVTIPAMIEGETVWLSQAQMAELFGKERSVITKHIRNAIREGEVDEKAVCAVFAHTAADGKTYQVTCYNLEVIISVGYRVKSRRGVEFRRWANGVLRQYILRGYAANEPRLKALGQVVQILRRTGNRLDARQVLSVVEHYSAALKLLDAYDHQRIEKPSGRLAETVLSVEECRKLVREMRAGAKSALFGQEKDDSFAGSIGAIYQTFDGHELYPSVEEKAANLLYFLVKNHSFLDGNKRIGAAIFLHFLHKHGFLLNADGSKRLDDHTLVALTLLIAESKPLEREIMVSLVMTFLTGMVP